VFGAELQRGVPVNISGQKLAVREAPSFHSFVSISVTNYILMPRFGMPSTGVLMDGLQNACQGKARSHVRSIM